MHTKIKRMQFNSSCTQIAHTHEYETSAYTHSCIIKRWSMFSMYTRSHSMPHTHTYSFPYGIRTTSTHIKHVRFSGIVPLKHSDASAANNTRQLISVEGSFTVAPTRLSTKFMVSTIYTKYFCTFTFLFAAYAKATVCDVYIAKRTAHNIQQKKK